MATRIRTLNFLPEIFQTPTNAQFLGATLDLIVDQPNTKKIQGYVGSKYGYGINAKNYYVTEPTKTRTDYQLDPSVIFTKPNESVAQDFITYPGIIDSLKVEGSITNNNSELFESEFYSWDSFTNLDKIINFNEYYWLPLGPQSVTVAPDVVFNRNEYIVTSLPNGYGITTVGSGTTTTNPTLTLLRGGSYTFAVNQDSQFWIQGEPGVTGFSRTQPNLQTRDVYGVNNNGENAGVVVFDVPFKNAQDEYNLPGNNLVDVISDIPFDQINGMPVNGFTGIDGVTSLEGLSVLFYNTGVINEIGYTSNFYDYTNYDTNNSLTNTQTISITQTSSLGNLISCNDTSSLVVNNTITFTGTGFGGLSSYSSTLPNTIYYVKSIVNSTQFTVSNTINGSEVTLTDAAGSLIGNINQGSYEQGYYSTVADNFYTVQYIGDPSNPVIRLVPNGLIPTNEKITAIYGTQYINRSFFKNALGAIQLIPYISSTLDILYYQDGTTSNKVGIIKLIDSNLTNTLNVETEILGKQNFTSSNGIVFTNGLKVSFQGDVIPRSYLDGEYYVEGVGTAIELIPTQQLVVTESFAKSVFIPWDTTPYDSTNWEADSFVPVDPDYITIARNSINKNAWSRSNRWFHIDVINATATYNNNPNLVSLYATPENKAKRPIIEFYPNLKLFDFGSFGKDAIDFIDFRTTDAFTEVAGQENYYPDVAVYTDYNALIPTVPAPATSINITVPENSITGTFKVGQYITDSTNILPRNSQVAAITVSLGIATITVEWEFATTFIGTNIASLIATDTTVDNYSLFEGAKIVFANDSNLEVRNKIYISRFSSINGTGQPVITLTEAENGDILDNDVVAVYRGYNYQGLSFYFTNEYWNQAQQKVTVNQSPLFDVFDKNGISFGNSEIYVGSSFKGNKLFAYEIGSGPDDIVLGFPVKYSLVNNVGDISFNVSLNSDSFNYVSGTTPITQKVNTGYVHNVISRNGYVRELGWKTAVSPSVQYQLFSFDFDPLTQDPSFLCDIPANLTTNWPVIQVSNNNVLLPDSEYTTVVGENTTLVYLNTIPTTNTVIEIAILSTEVSKTAYYQIPINLSNNPFNQDLTTVNVGDIRGQYQSIFYNNPNTAGEVFGSNNYRDLGNVVPWGTKIIQNSASLVLPGTFLRKQNYNLFNALKFNSTEYIKFKTLLMDTVDKTAYMQTFNPSTMLDTALDVMTSSKNQDQAFFWSDMLPGKAAFITNTYSFVNSLDVSIYPLSRVYDFSKANYYGVLVYLTRTVLGVTGTTQLILNQDYTVSSTSPSLTVTLDLLPGDKITIKEYNQTYGSYCPNTPTKLGLYPAYIPKVVLDDHYFNPTYFIRGHDGSYTKLYGDYNPVTGVLVDFKDQVLLEFEKRIYNNLKLSNVIPIQEYEVLPGFFRDTTLSYEEFLEIYRTSFLDWVGQNRVDYKTQFYNKNNEFTYNYFTCSNKINNEPIQPGYWRGIYQYFYDTTTPDATPWEMIGYKDQPSWWETRYGPKPYTSDNLVLWNDMAQGIDWNNGTPIIIEQAVRPGLLDIIPVDSEGNLLSPLISIVGNFIGTPFIRDWKIGDEGPTEFSYRRSSSWPFDLMRIIALSKPAKFYNLAVDLDNYKYNLEFNQYLVDNRSHLIISDVEIYGNGIAKTSYINWIVDYEKQVGIDATTNITTLLDNLDVRLVYRLAGFSDKTLLKFYVEKGTPNSNNASLLIPDESYSVLLYDNQPFDKIVYTGVIIQILDKGYAVYGNSQTSAYFKVLTPTFNGNNNNVSIGDITVKVPNNYSNKIDIVPYGTIFYTPQEVALFLSSYGAYLTQAGMVFDEIENGLQISWNQMIAEFLYWVQTGWEIGSIVTINPAANKLKINKDSYIVQPLTFQQTNFVLNENLYPIQLKDLNIFRNDTEFTVTTLNQGDSLGYGQFNISNYEHGIVFDNTTLFNDTIYNLVTGLKQNRIYLQGTKTAEWNGTVTTSGFVLNQDNIKEWSRLTKYTKGEIVKYKNKYWTAIQIVQAKEVFEEREWKRTDYNEIQKGLLPNASTRSYESTLYYDVDKANLESDADLLSFSLIGYRPRDYLAIADLTDITQINVYKNMIKNKGTRNAVNAFKGANLPQGGIDYEVYENWAIKSGEFGGVLNSNFIEFKLNQNYLTGNPSIVALNNGIDVTGVQQEIPLYSLYNYDRPINNVNVLPTIPTTTPSMLFPTAGYVNFNDVKSSAFYYSQMPQAVDKNGIVVPLQDLYVRDYVWLANYLEKWQVFTPTAAGQVINVKNNLNGTSTITFLQPHNLQQYQTFAVVNFNSVVDNYFIALTIVNPYSVIVALNLGTGATNITGNGVAFIFQSQRVDQPSDINSLPLLDSEFIKNKVWVDTNTDGSWAVYRKGINYQLENEITRANSQTFGSAVAVNDDIGYLVGDANLGEVYRYVYDPLQERYREVQTFTEGVSFGSNIAYAKDIYVITEPNSNKIHVYNLESTILSQNLVPYQPAITGPCDSVAISGDTNWIYTSDLSNNTVYVYRKTFSEYILVTTIDGNSLGLTVAGDNFGYSIATNYYGDTLIIGAPLKNYVSLPTNLDNWGYSYVFNRIMQNVEIQFSTIANNAQTLQLAWTPPQTIKTASSVTSNYVTLNNVTQINIDDPIFFQGTNFGNTGILANTIYYVQSIVGSTIALSTNRGGSQLTLVNGLVTLNAYVQTTPIYVSRNGTIVEDNNYAVVNNTLVYVGTLNAGDIITTSGQEFVLSQTLTTETTPRIGVQFGHSVDTMQYASDILVGAPFELTNNQQGSVYRFTNGGGKYGIIIGSTDVNVTTSRKILLNGYLVNLPIGNASVIANTINQANITNITATTLNNKLVVSLIDTSLATPNQKLLLVALDTITLSELGITTYTQTQVINCPHTSTRTQFGYTVKFNEYDSFVASAPAGSRFEATTFDFNDDELDNDTVFDNNTTQFIDSNANAGAVYMFDYLSNYNESLTNVGQFVYAQSVNSRNQEYGKQPYYGTALDFNNYNVIIGTPNFRPNVTNGQVITYNNILGQKDWSIFRSSSAVVDINRINNSQIFSAETNDTLINLDYIDPLQGKILGAARENIDVVSNIDPARYNRDNTETSIFWGANHLGQIWLDTSRMAYVNYHQNDVVYNSEYWGTLFPNSDPAVYSWISSTVTPDSYPGPGTPYNINSYSIQYVINSSGSLVPVYYFWVRNTNIIFAKTGKTLADSIVESYVRSSKGSGISYFAPLLPSTFGLYNCGSYINANDSVFHIGFSTGTNNDVAHNQYSLIRANFADDFLPGLPGILSRPFTTISGNVNPTGGGVPEGLYDRMLDSMCGVDESGQVVPNPFLPKAVQTGVLVRPRQSFFSNRFGALKNYLTYANEVLKQFPITETREYSFLFREGPVNPSTVNNPQWPGPAELFYNTTNYWEYTNWWNVGYDDNTKSALQVPLYSDLLTLNVPAGTIVTVEKNGNGKSETYVFSNTGIWVRIGLQNGTIQFKPILWDYSEYRLGFGDNFFDTTPYDSYPSEETRNIIRALNEEIYTDELIIYRNKSLILMFEYIQSEASESQNYLPWLNKTSFIDVAHKIRELKPIEVFQTDNQEFLTGYINEVKPYHVVVKEFLFEYTGQDVFEGDITDFDLPAIYNNQTQQFITPQLVYSTATGDNQFYPNNEIWQNPNYSQWFNNYGLSLTGENNYPVTVLASYMSLNTREIVVDNASGMPINGIIKLNNGISIEEIGYSSVDYNLNIVSGLTRGVNGTTITTHIPGEVLVMDLPPVLLLNGGRGYSEPPKVIAYIDTTKYPEPKTPAVLQAVMNLDSVLRIDVINPGQGYAVQPEIIIDSAIIVEFSSADVNVTTNTIQLYAPALSTGDLLQYKVGVGTTPINGLQIDQWYYVNVLEFTPLVTVALYTNYGDAIKDTNRVEFYSSGSGDKHSMNVGAKASCIISSIPVRENITTLRFDRTSYNSDVIEWEAGKFYGAYYAGKFYNTATASSSAVLLTSTQPPIETVLASGQGVQFEITDVRNDRVVDYSSLTRKVSDTFSGTNIIRLEPLDDGSLNPNSSGSTIGFYVGMPIKFVGATGVSNLVNQVEYYVYNIINDTDFQVSIDPNLSSMFAIGGNIGPAGLSCFTGAVIDTAILTVNYPGITTITQTQTGTNKLTIPLNDTGSGGTNGFYIGLPVFFTGNVFGGIVANDNYFVTTVCDKQTFTISTNPNPLTFNMVGTDSIDDTIIVDNAPDGLNIGDPVIFNGFKFNLSELIVGQEYTIVSLGTTTNNEWNTIAGTVGINYTDGSIFTATGVGIGTGTVTSNLFSNIQAGEVYYVSEFIGALKFKVSTSINVSPISISNTVIGEALITSQIDTYDLTNGTGSMTININLPVSPGQVDGQQFTLYETSGQYLNETGTNVEIIQRDIGAVISNSDIVAIKNKVNGLSNFYINMPVTFSNTVGNIIAGTTYFVKSMGIIQIEVTNTSANILTCNTTSQLYIDMPILFSGVGLGGIDIDLEYYVKEIVNSTQFTVTITPGGATTTLTTANGLMIGTGQPYIQISDSKGGSIKSLGDSQQTCLITVGNPAVVTVTTELSNNTVVTFRTTGTLPLPLIENKKYYVVNSTGTTFNICEIIGGETIATTLAGSGTHTVLVQDLQLSQASISNATFDVSYVMGGYRVIIENAGEGYAVNNTIVISGTQFNGTSPENDLTLTVNSIDTISIDSITNQLTSDGRITSVICSGTVPGAQASYYLKVISNNEFAVFANPLMTIPVSGLTLPFNGVTSTTATSITGSDTINVSSTVGFELNDPVVFTGNVFGGILIDIPYYITNIPSSTSIKVSLTPGGITINTLSNISGNMIVTKQGDYAVLPEPFYFNESIVKYNNRAYQCIVSNNDTEFVIGKWKLLDSGSRLLNALDRISVYYQPTDNMPGRNLAQLVDGIEYPNSTYLGNKFEPDQQFELDTIIPILPLDQTPTYNIQGDSFTSGYGPEELVPGLVTDNLVMTIATRPGTTWDATEYGHVGYNVVSREITPINLTQTEFSFNEFVQTPAQVYVAIIYSDGLSITIYQGNDYTVNWVDFIVTLNNPLNAGQKLRIDVYETGNGDQLVKANTKTDPIRYNEQTGWDEIYVNCNYSAIKQQGSGVIKSGTTPISVTVFGTEAGSDTIICENVTDFALNDPITFNGGVMGGLLEDTTYYVKTISTVTNRITVSLVYNTSTGTAGPTLTLTSDTGLCFAIINPGSGQPWTDPLVYYNGNKLVHGVLETVTRTNSGRNTVTCHTTGGIAVGSKVMFSNSMFGTDLLPLTTYYINSIYDFNEFTVSLTEGGPTIVLSDATGGAEMITNDYAFGIQPNGTQAKIIFADSYDSSIDYLQYTLFGETSPEQYGYTIPEVEMFIGDGSSSVFNLSNYISINSQENAIVEVNGLRLYNDEYTIDPLADTITFTIAPMLGDSITVTTYNLTDRQYMNTSYSLSTENVNNIVAINNTISPYLAITNVTNTAATGNVITCISTIGFVTGQTIQFKGVAFGNILTDGTMYYVRDILSPTTFTIQDENGVIISLTNDSGLIVAYVGGQPAVRVATGIPHNLSTNDIVRIDGTSGSVQLNNNVFYIHVINSTQFDLYDYDINDPAKNYDPTLGAVNYPITEINAYTGNGYVWLDGLFVLVTTTASSTSYSNNVITVNSTNKLVVNTPVYFTEGDKQLGDTTLGGIIIGKKYYVKEIKDSTKFTITETRGGIELILSTDSGSMNVTQWEQDNVDRLWVTVNGKRVPSSSLRLNLGNYLSILTTITAGDKVIITSMIPNATPNEEVYQLTVDRFNIPSVYRANASTKTWLTQDLYNTSESIVVNDARAITNTIVQNSIVPLAIDGFRYIGLAADKNIITNVQVYNSTKAIEIDSEKFEVVIEGNSPTLKIINGVYIDTNDQLIITILEGNRIYVNGEQIGFASVDIATNTLNGLQRGLNGTIVQTFTPLYSEVFGLLSKNKLSTADYNKTWNPIPGIYNTTLGDPLQISETSAAIFLNQGI